MPGRPAAPRPRSRPSTSSSTCMRRRCRGWRRLTWSNGRPGKWPRSMLELRRAAAGGSAVTVTTAAETQAYVGAPRRGPVTRLLEDERWLALLLLLPTLALLGLFIAYPFVEGVRLSVTDA